MTSRLASAGGHLYVDPKNPDVVYTMGTSVYRSTDGGKTLNAIKGAPGGDDPHAMWIDPTNPRRMFMGADQGPAITLDGGVTWTPWYTVPNGELYFVTTDDQFPYRIYAPQQDSGTVSILSRSDFGAIRPNDWYPVSGYEQGHIFSDPLNPRYVYSHGGGHVIIRFDRVTGQSGPVFTPAPDDRFGPRPGMDLSRNDPHWMFVGSQFVYASNDRVTWKRISPDLASRPGETPASRANGTIVALAASPLDVNLLWAATSNGLVRVTRDARQDVGERVAAAPRGGAHARALVHGGVAARRGHGVRRGDRSVRSSRPGALHDHRLRRLVARDRDGSAGRRADAGGARGSGPGEPAVRRHAARHLRVVRSRRELAAAAAQPPARAGAGHHRARRRPRHRHVGARPVGARRRVAAAGRSTRCAPARRRRSCSSRRRPCACAGTTTRTRRCRPRSRRGRTRPTAWRSTTTCRSAAGGPVTITIRDASGAVAREFTSVAPPPDTRMPNVPAYWFKTPETTSTAAGMHRLVWDLRYPTPPALDFSADGTEADTVSFGIIAAGDQGPVAEAAARGAARAAGHLRGAARGRRPDGDAADHRDERSAQRRDGRGPGHAAPLRARAGRRHCDEPRGHRRHPVQLRAAARAAAGGRPALEPAVTAFDRASGEVITALAGNRVLAGRLADLEFADLRPTESTVAAITAALHASRWRARSVPRVPPEGSGGAERRVHRRGGARAAGAGRDTRDRVRRGALGAGGNRPCALVDSAWCFVSGAIAALGGRHPRSAGPDIQSPSLEHPP